MDAADPRLKAWGIALGVLVVVLALVDMVVLKGEFVSSASISLQPDTSPGIIEISRPGEKHLVQISTRRRVRGEYVGQSVAWRLVAPDGTLIEEESELLSHKKRFFEFLPAQAGPYALHMEESTLLGSARGTASVSVYVGDRRILGPLLGF
jgi:hypothetical protein